MVKKKKPSLKSKLKGVSMKSDPIWKGPESNEEQGGVTQSLLSRFIVCKERFRILTIEGRAPHENFSVPLEYGQMWHTCEEYFAEGKDWEKALKNYCTFLARKYKTEQIQVLKWYNVCLKQFPIYTDYWKKHSDVKKRTPLLQEECFNVPYELPSGRVVFLRGKWDSVDIIGNGTNSGIYIQENKSKGQIDENYLLRQLTMDLQTMIYTIALEEHLKKCGPICGGSKEQKVKGVRYNVIRRPLSGGRRSIKKLSGKKYKTKPDVPPETDAQYYTRLQQYFIEEPEYWFMRWKVEISQRDIENFKKQFLDPCLEHLCLWYDLQNGDTDNITRYMVGMCPECNDNDGECMACGGCTKPGITNFLHYRLPYGVYNSVMEGRGSDVEEYMLTGSLVGLRKVKDLFPELK